MNYKIGLDIGITSVGWAVLQLDEQDEPCKILRLGSRIFDSAENQQDGASLALPRREQRGARRTNRRRRHRLERIRALMVQQGLMSEEELERLYENPRFSEDVYSLRCRGLDERLEREEWARVLIHLARRRGFRSNRKAEEQEKGSESGKLLSATRANEALRREKGYRTIGEMLYRDAKFAAHKRNQGESYDNTFTRQEYGEEIALLFAAQRRLGNPVASEDFEARYTEIYMSQRSFDEGPGGSSPYGGNQIEKMLGNCTFEQGEKRAFKAQFSWEYCTLLQKLNTIQVESGGNKRKLTDAERKKAVDLAFSKATLTYAAIRKALPLKEGEAFNLSYGKDRDETEKKTKLAGLPCYHKMKKAYGDGIHALTRQQLNDLGYVLSAYKQDEKIKTSLAARGFDAAQVEAALTLPNFSKAGHLSVKACDKLIPFLEQGMTYDKACEAAGYAFKKEGGEKQFLLNLGDPELEELTNPVVRRAVSQTIKVINGIIRSLGESPSFVSIELARELAKDFQERQKIKKEQGENAAVNERLRQKITADFHIPFPTGQDILKLRLWEEQDGVCPYSRQKIRYESLFESGYVDIDHIVPYSVSFNDSYRNKVLVLTRENRQKGNRLPLEYLQDRDSFIVWVQNQVKDPVKRGFLLREALTPEEREEWKERSLNDTKYLSKFLFNYLRRHLQTAPNHTGRKKTVAAVNGAVTAYMRKRWGIRKIREDGDTHHAVDAAVVACVTDGMIRSISRYASHREKEYQTKEGTVLGYDKDTGEAFDKFPLPYPEFRKELEMRTAPDPMYELKNGFFPQYAPDETVAPIFVSRMPKRKATGPAHAETVRRPVEIDGLQYTVSKTPLTKLKLDRDGEIDGYYELARRSDRLLYQALRDRLLAYGGKGEKAFAEAFHKPKSDGTPGPVVKTVPILKKATLTVPVQQQTGVADNGNGSRVRTDVFHVEGEGYYLVPVYVADTVKPELPNRAVVPHKPYEQWKEMREQDFLFSLYAGDLVRVTVRKEQELSLMNPNSTLPKKRLEKEFFAYYTGMNISGGSIGVESHDGTYQIESLGVKRLEALEKYEVDVLGNVTKIKRETRRRFR